VTARRLLVDALIVALIVAAGFAFVCASAGPPAAPTPFEDQ
jgi:hypothetical protein